MNYQIKKDDVLREDEYMEFFKFTVDIVQYHVSIIAENGVVYSGKT